MWVRLVAFQRQVLEGEIKERPDRWIEAECREGARFAGQLEPRLAGYQPILDRLLAKKPEARFRSARELFATIAV